MATKKISAGTILARMQDKPGVRYPTSAIAKIFRVNSRVVRPMLDGLVRQGSIKSVVEGKFTVFWVPTEGELQAARNRVERATAANVAKPLQGYQDQLTSHMRLCMGLRK